MCEVFEDSVCVVETVASTFNGSKILVFTFGPLVSPNRRNSRS